jgi:hypothetical protein
MILTPTLSLELDYTPGLVRGDFVNVECGVALSCHDIDPAYGSGYLPEFKCYYKDAGGHKPVSAPVVPIRLNLECHFSETGIQQNIVRISQDEYEKRVTHMFDILMKMAWKINKKTPVKPKAATFQALKFAALRSV